MPCVSVAQETFVTCWDDVQKETNYRFHRLRGPVLTNAHGWQVYVDAEARPARMNTGQCVNTSRLMMKAPKGGAFVPVYITRPGESALGNDLKLLGWSGDQLLFIDTSWQYASDAYSHQIVIFEAPSGTFSMPDLGKIVAEQLRLKCDLDPVAKGWNEGKVLFGVTDTELGTKDPAGCMAGKPKWWVFDPKNLSVSVAPEGAGC
jgi:hypothetical protein